MNRELALLLRNRLLTLPWVDKANGMAKTIGRQRVSESGKVEFQRFPATLDSVEPLNPGQYADLVPDSTAYRNLFYFEDISTRITGRSRGVTFESVLRLVGWLDHKYQADGDILAIASILNAIPEHPGNTANLFNITVTPGRVLGVEDKIFSKYTYSEHLKQYLMAPYSAFAIDYTCTFSLNPNCVPEYNEGEFTPVMTFTAAALSSKEILLTWV